ncbi:MAG: glycine zipper 2TM domain-containing protein [Pseudohongiellaceae bacterium]
MNKSLVKVSSLLMAFVSWSATADTSYEYADVLASTPIYRIVEIEEPREQCWEEEVVVEQRSRRQASTTPVIVSTILGGAIGNAVGNNRSSQRVGAVVGAVLGHSVGRDIVRNRGGRNQQYVETVERCDTVYEQVQEERLVGYQVTYLYQGEERTVRADSDPGEQIRVRISVEPVL